MPINPCGMVVDMLRSCYSTMVKFFVDSDLEIPVQWYFCDEHALPYPGHTLFGSGNWASSRDDWPGPGEVLGAPRPWNNGLMPRNLNDTIRQNPDATATELVDFITQDPVSLLVTITFLDVHYFVVDQRVWFEPLPFSTYQIVGPFHIRSVPNQMQIVIHWPKPIRGQAGAARVSPLKIWGEFLGQYSFGDPGFFENGGAFDATVDSHTNAQGLCLAAMPLAPECWLTLIDVRNPVGTDAPAGRVFHLVLQENVPQDVYLVIQWLADSTYSSEPPYALDTWQPFFGVPIDGLGLNPGLLPSPTLNTGNESPDAFSLDQSTFWWNDFNAVQPDGFPDVPNMRWTCVLTFYDPAATIPGPGFPLFFRGFFPSGFFPQAFGF